MIADKDFSNQHTPQSGAEMQQLDPARYGLDRFSVTMTSTEGEGVLVKMAPFTFGDLEDKLIELMLEGADENNKAVAFMTRDGHVHVEGLKPGMREAMIPILRQGRDTIMARYDELMSETSVMQSVKMIVDRAAQFKAFPTSAEDLKVACPCCTSKSIIFEQILRGQEIPEGEFVIIGAMCNYPGDFQADYATWQAQRVFTKLVESMPKLIEETDKRMIELEQIRMAAITLRDANAS